MKKKNHQIARPPSSNRLDTVRSAAHGCLVCAFARKSTQTVFGEGGKHAVLMIVGEVPGDVEDRLGHPFVGPAGVLLHELINELKIDPAKIYLTNAVKHFKFVRQGKKRLHQRPNATEIRACRPWLEKEMASLQPRVVLALGATAAATLCGRSVQIQKERSKLLSTPLSGARVLVSWHPSAILRTPDSLARKVKREQLKKDLHKSWKAALKVD